MRRTPGAATHCLVCGRLCRPGRNDRGRCLVCISAWNRQRNADRKGLYGGTWGKESRAARQAEPWCHRILVDGTLCAATSDLTKDHETGKVECRRCNSSHRRNP